MKYLLTIFAVILLITTNSKAELVSIDLKAAYVNDVWFDFNNAVIKSEPSNNWTWLFKLLDKVDA